VICEPHIKQFKNERSQAAHISIDFNLLGFDAIINMEGTSVILEVVAGETEANL
jgi:virulence-associated protein VagC